MSMGDVTITAPSGSREYRLFGPMMLVGGEPSWNVVDRAKRQPVSAWGGRALYALELPFILDGWSTKTPVGTPLAWLRGLMAAANDNGVATPRPVTISGAGIMEVPNKDVRTMQFVAVGLDVDADSIIRAEDGALLRCAATLTLQEYVAPPSVEISTTFSKAAAQKKIIRVMVRKGDTHATIANRPGIPKQYRARVKSFFLNHPETRTKAKLQSRAGKIYSITVS